MAAGSYRVDIAGIAAKAPVECGDCLDLNATYIVESPGMLVPGAFGGCWWQYAVDPPVCDVARVVLGIGVYSYVPAKWIVIVYLVDADSNILAAAAKIYATDRPECLNFDAEDLGALTFYATMLGCDVAATSVTVSSLRPCYIPLAFDPASFDVAAFH
jgi:hypothetical protein